MADSPVIGFEILAMKRACEELPAYRRSDCPVCGWMLQESADGIIFCKFCGWQDQYPLKRDVPRP